MKTTAAVAVVVAMLVAGVASHARAQGAVRPLDDYTVTTWNENEGLPAGRIRAIEQGADGYLWIGTEAGLVRFDGVRFVTWGAPGELRLPTGTVTTLMSARDRSLWIGINGTVGRLRDGRMVLYSERDGLGNGLVVALLEDHAGTVWAGTLRGLYQFDGTRWTRVGLTPGTDDASVLAVFEDRERRLWAATSTAIFRRTGGSPFEHVDDIDISSNVYQSFSADAAGTVWISDFREGFRKPGEATSARRPLRRGWGVRLLHDRRGNMWVGTQGQGLWRVRTDATTPSQRTEAITAQDGLASQVVQALLEDREGNIWIGTHAGLQRLSPHKVTPIRSLAFARVVETTTDGSVWVGTAAGLARFSSSGRRDFTEADGLPGSVILALRADERGGLWIATERGVTHFADGRFSAPVLPPGKDIQRVFSIRSAGSGALWLRDFNLRLFRWSHDRLAPAEGIPDDFLQSARAIETDRQGALWIGLANSRLGVKRANGTFQAFQLAIGSIVSIVEDRDGTVWAGGEDGLGRVAGGRAVSLTRRDGFPGAVKAIVEDEAGSLWVAVTAGIIRLEKREVIGAASDSAHQLQYRLLNTADGVAGVPVSEGAQTGVRARDGRLWFVTSSGVTIVDPRRLGDPPPMPPVRIESITADAQPLDLTSSGLLLRAGTSHVQTTFTALALADPRRVRFRYRLEGFDRDWVDAGSARQAAYTNLSPREYRFRVEASNGDGVWAGGGATVDFALEPMFYQTRWFAAGGVAAAFLIVGGVWRLRVRRVRRQFALVLAERIRMSRAIHDTLLQGLAGLALQVDDLSHTIDGSPAVAKDRVLRIRLQVEEYIREARQSIWDLRSPRLEARGLAAALREAGERAVADRSVRLDFDVTGTPHRCAPSTEEQLLLIGQEALNNAVHHGQATCVKVELDYGADRTRLSVSDDGCGFDVSATPAGGHCGLSSMRERAEYARGRVRIESAPGRGTQVEAVVPTA